MAVGLSATEANAIVNGLSGLYFQIHIGDPGAAGTANQATETTRKQITLASASGGSATNSGALTWTTIAGTQTPTHFSLHTASSGGTFEFSGTITADQYTAGTTFEIGIGDVTISIPTVAA